MTRKQRILLLLPITIFASVTVFLFQLPYINYGKAYSNDSLISMKATGSSIGAYMGSGDGSASIEGFNGVVTIYVLNIKSEKETFKYSCNINLENGSFKIVLVTEAGEVITLAENGNSINQSIELPEGKHQIKIVGKNASAEFSLSPNTSTDNILIERLRV